MFRSLPVFPFRSPAGGQQPKLPACRAWRIVSRAGIDFDAALPAVVDGWWPPGPPGLWSGIYPLLVRRTDPSGGELGTLLCVEGDGWQAIPMGPDWRIDYVLAAGLASDRFAYVVECTDDLRECGQVNIRLSSIIFPPTYAVTPGDKGWALRIMRLGMTLWDSGAVGGGAAINSPSIMTAGLETLLVVADNSAGAAPRNVVIDFRNELDLSIDNSGIVSIPAAKRGKVAVGHGALTNGLEGAIAASLSPVMRFSLAAGGSAAGRLVVMGR